MACKPLPWPTPEDFMKLFLLVAVLVASDVHAQKSPEPPRPASAAKADMLLTIFLRHDESKLCLERLGAAA
jgi:hypothetical protein